MSKNEIFDIADMVNSGEMSLKDCMEICNAKEGEIVDAAAFAGVQINGLTVEINRTRRVMGW